MRLLLDTHIAIWATTGDPRLSRRAAPLISDPANDVYFSLATLLEIAIKNATGRSNLGMTAQQAVAEFAAANFEQLPIAERHIAELEGQPVLHGDPFDRLIVATAKAEGCRLITHDDALGAYGDHVLIV